MLYSLYLVLLAQCTALCGDNRQFCLPIRMVGHFVCGIPEQGPSLHSLSFATLAVASIR